MLSGVSTNSAPVQRQLSLYVNFFYLLLFISDITRRAREIQMLFLHPPEEKLSRPIELPAVDVVHLHVDRLELGVELDGGQPVLPAHPGGLHAAEGHLGRADVEVVHPAGARVDVGDHPVGARQILGEHSA